MSNFEALGLLPELIQAVEDMGWTLPSAVQDESIPLILGGGDVLIAAETGSGKTGAFALPILQNIYEHIRGDAKVDQKVVLKNTLAGDANEVSSSSASSIDTFHLSSTDRDNLCAVDIASGSLLVQTRHPRDWGGVRANCGVKITPGHVTRVQYEATVTDEGLCRVGWALPAASRNLGTDALSWGFGGTGKKSNAGKFDDYGQAFGLNDVIGCFMDATAAGTTNLAFTKNGQDLGVAFSIPSAQITSAGGLFPAVVLKNAEMRFNFGTTPFKFPRQGFTPLNEVKKEDRVLPPATSTPTSSTPAPTPAAASSSSTSSKKPGSSKFRSPFALIFEPTRELALQVSEEIEKFKTHLQAPQLRHECFVAGSDQKQLERALAEGVHILIGTPGRLMELVNKKLINVAETRNFVLDEADQLIGDAMTKQSILAIYELLPKTSKSLQIIICSATLHSDEIQDLSRKLTQNATWVDLKGVDSVPDSVDHVVVIADPVTDRAWTGGKSAGLKTDGVHAGINLRQPQDTPELLSEGLKLLKPAILLQIIEEFKMDQCMIFVRTQVDCDNLENFLIAAGGGGTSFRGKKESGKENIYSCVVLHGGRSPQERTRNFDAFKSGDVRFLICTDVAARGIDIKNLPFVLNLCLPDKPETYIHRIGRVGRADAIGLAISVVARKDIKEKVWWHTCSSKDKGRSCTNTKLTSQGGCTIWQDEHDLLKQIETRLGGVRIPELDRANLLQGMEFIVKEASKGRKPADDGTTQSNQHVTVLRPTVDELSRLEVTAQKTFWNVKQSNKWKLMLQ